MSNPMIDTPGTFRHASATIARAMVVVGLLAFSLPARAEAPQMALPSDATLTRLIDESLAARPELAKAEAVVHAEQERISQAGAWPDPMLQIGIQNDGFTSIEVGRMETSFVSFMASQTFPWPGKTGLRKDVATLGATQGQQLLMRARLSTEAEVRRVYLDLLVVRDKVELLEELAAIWEKSFGVARVRYEAGNGAQSDVLRAQLEQIRIKQRRIGLEAEERSRFQALNRLRNHPLGEPIAISTRLRDLPPVAQFADRFSPEQALARSPELAEARLGIARAERSVTLAEKSYYPDLVVGTGVMVRGMLPPMWLVTMGGALPVFAASKQRRAVAENRAWASAAQDDVAAVEQVLRLRSEERRTAFSALVQTIDLYNQGLLVQSGATSESTLSQYKVGKVTFASVLEANSGLIADRGGYLQAVAAAYRVLIAEAEASLAPTVMPGGDAGASAAMPGAGSSTMETANGGSTAGGAAPPVTGGSASGM